MGIHGGWFKSLIRTDYFGECAPSISEQSEPLLLGMDLMM